MGHGKICDYLHPFRPIDSDFSYNSSTLPKLLQKENFTELISLKGHLWRYK